MEEFLKFLGSCEDVQDEAAGESPPVSDGSRKRSHPDTWSRPLYSQDPAQKKHRTQGDGPKGEDGEEESVMGEEPGPEEEISPQGSPEPSNFLMRQMDIKEEETFIQISTEPSDFVRNCKVGEDVELDIKEEPTFIPISTVEPRDLMLQNCKVEEDEQLHIKEEQTFMQINTEHRDLLVRDCKLEEELDIKEENTFMQISTEPGDPMMFDCKVEEDDQVDIKEEQTFIPIEEQQYRVDAPHLSSDYRIDYDITSDRFEENIDPELSSEGIAPGWLPAVSHLESHSKVFPCAQCGECFTERAQLLSHRSCSKVQKAHVCPSCGDSFEERAKLLVHKISHKTSKPYPCPRCGKRFSDRCSLSQHKKTHTEEFYMCSKCGLIFSKESYLLEHLCEFMDKNPQSGNPVAEQGPQSEVRVAADRKSDLVKRQKEDPVAKDPLCCLKCGRHFVNKMGLRRHRCRALSAHHSNFVSHQKELASPTIFWALPAEHKGASMATVIVEEDTEENKEQSITHRKTEPRDPRVGNFTVKEDEQVDIKEEQHFIPISTEPRDLRVGNFKVGEDEQVDIKEEQHFIPISTEPSDPIVRNYKVEEDEEVDIKEEKILMQLNTEASDLMARNHNVQYDGQIDIKEEQTSVPISTEHVDFTVRICKVEEDGQGEIKEEQELMPINKDEQQYGAHHGEETPHLSSEFKIEDGVTSDPLEESIGPESASNIPRLVPRSEVNLFPCPQRGECFTEKAELPSHQSRHTVQRAHVCSSCGESFDERAKLIVHRIRIQSSKLSFVCVHCNQRFSDKCSFTCHKKTHEEEVRTCPECGLTFSKECYLLEHLSAFNVQNSQTGSLGLTSAHPSYTEHFVSFDCKLGPLSHKTKRVVVRSFRCLKCGRGFSSKKGVRKHKCTGVFQTEELKCLECEKTFPSQDCLLYHKMMHDNPPES